MTERTINKHAAWPIAATFAVLAGVQVDKNMFHTPPDDASAYHHRILVASSAVPLHIGPWLGTDTPVPQAAVEMLHSNMIVSRQYHNIQSGENVSFLIAQVRDVRDMLGHYPPVCYPGRGWNQRDATPREWQLDGLTVRGTQYSFSTGKLNESRIMVDNIVILPDGNTYRDMEEASAAAQDHRRKFFGAAQIQLVFDGSMSKERRQQISETFLSANRFLIDLIRGQANNRTLHD